MSYIKTYESFMGDLARKVIPNREENDEKAKSLAKEILQDFEDHSMDLRKVKLNDNSKKFNLSEVSIGDYFTITYIFGDYHPINNNIFSSNIKDGNRKVKIMSFPLSVVLKKNELEKMFNTSRVTPRVVRVEDIKYTHNYSYNPNDQNSEEPKYLEKSDKYYATYDVGMSDLYKFFLDLYNRKYPQLKDKKSKTPMDVSSIEGDSKRIESHKKGMEQEVKSELIDMGFGEGNVSTKSWINVVEVFIKFSEDEKDLYEKLYQTLIKNGVEGFDLKRHKLEKFSGKYYYISAYLGKDVKFSDI